MLARPPSPRHLLALYSIWVPGVRTAVRGASSSLPVCVVKTEIIAIYLYSSWSSGETYFSKTWTVHECRPRPTPHAPRMSSTPNAPRAENVVHARRQLSAPPPADEFAWVPIEQLDVRPSATPMHYSEHRARLDPQPPPRQPPEKSLSSTTSSFLALALAKIP